ncbi:MAG: matrixin family metalloprotease [Deltaproteobacteria bacterium]|nr:matrixin family metalloprotease [Deltaproteobacteria bacterium]
MSRLVVCTLWVMGLVRPALAFNCTLSDSNPLVSIHWEGRSVAWAMVAPGPSGMDSVAATEVIRGSFDAWSTAECSDLRFEMLPVIDGTGGEDDNRVLFLRDFWPHGPEAVALTTVAHRSKDGLIQRARIEVNDSAYDFSASVEACDGELYDLGAVLTHEVGHFIGLAHTQASLVLGEDTDPTMTAVVEPCDASFRTLERDDVEAICFIYPIGGAARTCASLPEQEDPYVRTEPFGCGATGVGGASLFWILGLALLVCLRERRIEPTSLPSA